MEYNPAPESKPGKQLPGNWQATTSILLSFTSFCFGVVTGLPAVILGIFGLMVGGKTAKPAPAMAVCGIVFGSIGTLWTLVLVALLLPAVFAAGEAARRMEAANQLKQIGLGMHNYHDANKRFPTPGSTDPQFEDETSWRVRILPFVEASPTYDRYDQNSPWNSSTNMALIPSMPDSYRTPGIASSEYKTAYLAVKANANLPPNHQFRPLFSSDPKTRTGFADILDGTSNTIAVVNAGPQNAVTWTQPDDYEFDPDNPQKGLPANGVQVLMADGSVKFLSPNISPDVLRSLMGKADGVAIPSLGN